MSNLGRIQVGSAFILITPEMDQAALKAELDRAQEAIAKFSGSREKLAKQTARLEAKLQAWITAQYGEEAAKRVEAEKNAIEARKKLSKSETASYLKAMATVTAAQERELAEREKQQAAFAKYVEKSNARIAAAERAEVEASAKAVIAAEKEKAAEVARQAKAREAQISSLSKLVIRQASMEATAAKTAAREAQAAYTEAYNSRKAQALSTLEAEKSANLASAQSALRAAQAEKAANLQRIRQNEATVRALQANAKKVEKSWTGAVYNVGGKLGKLGTTMTEFGRTVNRSLVTPLMTAAGAMSYLGISAADSMMQAQTALQRMGVSRQDTAKQINELKNYGTATPYSVEDMFKYGTQYARAGKAHGRSGKDASKRATDLVEAIGNLSAFAGITDPQQVGRAMYAVSIMQDADRASLRNVKSLADNAGIPIQELATTFGFTDRAFTKKEIKAKLDQQKKKGIHIALPKEYTASAQMMDWMADAKTTGGVPGEGIVDALLKRGRDKKVAGAARSQGSATISARLSNMWEQGKFGLADMFISPTGKGGSYQYTGAGKALMGKGGLLDSISGIGSGLKRPAGKLIEEFFHDLTLFTDFLKKTVQVIHDHPGLEDMLIKAGKFAAIIGTAALALGTLSKLLGFVTKGLSPLAGVAKGIGKLGKGAGKIIGRATGLGTKTDAQLAAKAAKDAAKAEAKQIRKDAKNLASRNDRKIRNRYADQVERQGRSNARDIERQGRQDTSFRDRYRQRRDNSSPAQRETNRLDVDTSQAQRHVNELDDVIAGLKAKIADLKGENLKPLAEEFAGKDSSVKAKADLAAKAVREAETAVKNFRSLQLGALDDEFGKVTKKDDEFKTSVKHSEVAVSGLNDKNLSSLGKEFKGAKAKSDSLKSAAEKAAGEVNKLDGETLGKLKAQIDHVKDATDTASKKVGSGETSLIHRVGQLNSQKLTKIVEQMGNLKKKIQDTSAEALILNGRLDSIAKHAPEGHSSSKGGSSSTKRHKKATGGVLPGYTPGRDVHKFISPTAGELHLSGGESIMRPEWTEAVGHGFVHKMNHIARTKGAGGIRHAMKFASGGILGKMGLDKLIEASKNFNIYGDALGAFSTMTMDSSSRQIGGDAQSGVVGAGTSGSHFIGSDLAQKLEGMKNFMSRDSWKLLKKLPIPDGYSQAIGIVGGAVGPIAGDYFWNDVWKGKGNILQRGETFLNDLLSWKTLKSVVGNFFGGIWDTVKSVWDSGTSFLSDPVGAVTDTVKGVWDLVEGEYDGVIDMVNTIKEIYSSPMDYASQVWGDIESTAKDSLPNLKGLFDFSGNHLKTKAPDVSKLADSMLSTPGKGSAVTRWTPQVKMALAQLGLPASALQLVLHRIGVESGGNPSIINTWDSNAKAGHPSQGLMQTIPSTFNAYAGPYRNRGMNDPLANIYAGLNYAVHRYGSGWMKALSGTKGYATGTTGATKGWAWVGEEGPELVNFGGGETVLNHQDSMLATVKVLKGYATGTGSKRTTGVAADAEKGVSSLNSAVNKLYQIIKDAFTSNRISSKTANSLNKWLDGENKQLQKLVKDRTDLAPKLKDANAKLAQIKKDESTMAQSISDKASGLRSLTDVFNDSGVSASAGLNSLHERLAAIKGFQSDLTALTKKGFSKEILSEIAQAGPEQGDAMAKELLKSTAAQVTDYNKTYAAIGTASDSLGKSVASNYYAAGKKSAQALVDGLTAKDNKLKKQIESIADTITNTLNKKLHFNSKTPVSAGLASLLTWLTGEGQAVKGGGNTSKKKTTRVTTTYSTDSKGRKVTTVTTTTTDPAKGTTTTVTERTVGGKTTKTTRVSKIKGYATGTRSASPGIALVGEKGPELINFGGGERVYTAKDTAGMVGPKYEIHIHEAKAENTTQAVLRAMKYAETMAAL
ncbi:transglycosylase SLT domain-containing protein [Streptomyces sp. 1222.5]|uniref:transglycosylase SLT domain-containing protein n=1 Tax=Streptomyces sp. 1222.5 TaxID=1881026 RepID=UPI003EBF71D0